MIEIPFRRGYRAHRRFTANPGCDDDLIVEAQAYWTSRGFSDWTDKGYALSAKRGSLLGNLISFDMSKLLATLELQVSEGRDIFVEMKINGFGQTITLYNRAFWALELATFESMIRKGDPLPDVWSRFEKAARQNALGWSLTFGANAGQIGRQTAEMLGEAGADLEEVVPFGVK